MPRAARTKKLLQEHYLFIDNAMAENDELTTHKLMILRFAKFPNLDVSLSTVKRAKLDLGWGSTKPRYCQLIREANRSKQLTWCEERTAEGDTFDDVVWSDESSVVLDSHRKICYRKKGQPPTNKPRPKHPAKIRVGWDFETRGNTSCAIQRHTHCYSLRRNP